MDLNFPAHRPSEGKEPSPQRETGEHTDAAAEVAKERLGTDTSSSSPPLVERRVTTTPPPIAQKVQETLLRAVRGLEQTLASTQNHARVEKILSDPLPLEGFVPVSSIPESSLPWPKINQNDLRSAFFRVYQRESKDIEDSPDLDPEEKIFHKKELVKYFYKLCTDLLEKPANPPPLITRESLDAIQSEMKKRAINKVYLEEVERLAPNFVKFYRKEELLETLQHERDQRQAAGSRESDLDLAIENIQQSEYSYVDLKSLPAEIASLCGGCTEYYSSSELASCGLSLAPTDPSFIIRRAEANPFEVKGGVLARSLGLGTYILRKIPVASKDPSLSETIASYTPSGKMFPPKLWQRWTTMRRNVAQFQARAPEGVLSVFESVKSLVLKETSDASVSELLLLDLVFASGSSHIANYRIDEKGDLILTDWKQMMPAATTYNKGKLTFCAVHHELLEHPVADKPMPTALKEQILAWNCDDIEAEWQDAGLIEPHSFFEAISNELKEMQNERESLYSTNISKAKIEGLCEKYGIPAPERFSPSQRNQLEAAIQARMDQTKAKAYGKLHPQAVAEWRSRVEALQHYVRENEKATLRGGWETVYPELAPFVKALEPLESEFAAGLTHQVTSEQELKEDRPELDRVSRRVLAPTTRTRNYSEELRGKFRRAGKAAARRYEGTSRDAVPMSPDYIGEFLDIKNRYGMKILPYWNVWSSTPDPEGLSFRDWIAKIERGEKVAGQERLDRYKLTKEKLMNISQVSYIDPGERDEYRLRYENGLFRTEYDNPLHSGRDTHMFVMGLDEEFYTEAYVRGVFNHSIFFEGKPVKSAGICEFVKGKLVSITDKSGHYQPDERMTLTALEKFASMLPPEEFNNLDVHLYKYGRMKAPEAVTVLREAIQQQQSQMFTALRSLESIIVKAKKGGRVSQEEILKLEEALQQRKENPLSSKMMALTHREV